MKNNFKLFQNRELSYLDFNHRILLLAEDKNVPLMERLKFLQIFDNNLDEFFMIRVGSIFDNSILHKKKTDPFTNLLYKEQLELIFEKIKDLIKEKDKILGKLLKVIGKDYIEQISLSKLDNQEYSYLKKLFEHEILPLISPQIIDKHHPFPFLKDRDLYVCVRLLPKKKESVKVGIIPTTGAFDRLIIMPAKSKTKEKIRFILAEDIILHFSHYLFSKYKIISRSLFRVTRSADLDIDEELDDNNLDMKTIMANLLQKRKKLIPVRLELYKSGDTHQTINYLSKKLSLSLSQIFVNRTNINLSFISKLLNKIDKYEHSDLFYKKIFPKIPSKMKNISMINEIANRDILLSHPFDSINPFIKLLDQAAEDNDVVSIKITLYRVAYNSQIISNLKKAADNGKDVLVVVELQARFDEQNNIEWATSLEESGCKVIYGLEGYKVHAKVLLITRKIEGNIHYISQVGTGNYNETTSKTYTDLSLMTANQEIGNDILQLFNNLCTGTLVEFTSKILTSPNILKIKLLQLISDEILIASNQQPAEIIIKCNSLQDKDIIMRLIDASNAGVKIYLIIRGICCLLPGIKGYTENIQIKSIIGPLLEHSRIYSFGVSDRKQIYISSADLMVRNMLKRIEVACPIMDHKIKNIISSLLSLYINDNTLCSQLTSDGKYVNLFYDETKVDSSTHEIRNSQDIKFHQSLETSL